MATLEKAIEIACKAHKGQVDKGGSPYILHPLRVMQRLSSLDEMIVGVLHDVVEDSDFSLQDLRDEGFSESVLEALDALTKRPGEDRLSAAQRAKRNVLAKAVKLADNAENSDLSRIPNPGPKDIQRIEEYKEVRALLLSEGLDETLKYATYEYSPVLMLYRGGDIVAAAIKHSGQWHRLDIVDAFCKAGLLSESSWRSKYAISTDHWELIKMVKAICEIGDATD